MSDADSALFDAMLAVAQNLELPEVLRGIVHTAADLIGARYAALGVLSHETQAEHTGCPVVGGEGFPTRILAEFHHTGLTPEQVSAIGPYPRGRGVLGTLIDRPEPLRLADLSAHPDSVGFPEHHPPMHSFLGVPVIIRGAVYGNLYLTEKVDGGEFDEDDERLLIALAAIAAAAINNARLFDASQRQRRWLSAGTEAVGLITRDGEHVGDRLAGLLRTAGEADRVAIALPGTDDDELPQPLAFTSADGVDAEGLLGPMSPELALLTHAGVGKPSGPAVPVDEQTVIAPLRAGTRLLGVAMLQRAHPAWREDELQFITSFADQMALALEHRHNERNRHRLAVYSDRDRIARDLHDQVIQRIFAVGLGLQSLQRRTTDPDSSSRLSQHIDDLDATIAEIRTTIFSLQHQELDDRGLRAAIADVVSGSARSLRFEPHLTVAGPIDEVPQRLHEDVTAVLRESLSNVARHARASSAQVVAVVDPASRTFVLEVSDDGIGIPPEPPPGDGLRNLRARAAACGGTVEIAPGPTAGTVLAWRIPLPIR